MIENSLREQLYRYCYENYATASPLHNYTMFLGFLILIFLSLCSTISLVLPPYIEIQSIAKIKQRKALFLLKFSRFYGYSSNVSDPRFIDHWRRIEFPGLIPPISHKGLIGYIISYITNCIKCIIWRKSVPVVHEVYLDYAGSSLPTQSQLQAIYHDSRQHNRQILGNPHSSGPAAARTWGDMDAVNQMILNFFGANSIMTSPASHAQCTSFHDMDTSTGHHPGYHILFTSGATDSLRIVAENFPWTSGSLLLYSHNSHTSVIGIRGSALQKGASFQCVHIARMSQTLDELTVLTDDSAHDTINNLIVLPLECNFTGSRYDRLAPTITQKAQDKSNHSVKKWFTFLDISKAAATAPVNLCSLDPDFACVSFYKLFGYPTGIGVLFVKRSISYIITGQPRDGDVSPSFPAKRGYFGGGSVDAISPYSDFVLPRSRHAYLSSLIHGTPNYRNIILLKHGLDAIAKLGGMKKIHEHTQSLIVELVTRLQFLCHPNGQRAVVLYGRWREYNPIKFDANHRLTEMMELPMTECGPTVSFNLLRPDGSFVGYHEIEKLASLSNPAIQLRTGCFCNSGSCQEALGYTDEEMIQLASKKMKICGDNKDLIDGKPTGAVRVSFGPYSTFEDMDALVTFLEKLYIDTVPSRVADKPLSTLVHTDTCQYQIAELYVFPIKSCAAMRVKQWTIDAETRMLKFDREFAIVDSFGVALRLSVHPKLTLIEPRIDCDKELLFVRAPNFDDLIIDISPKGSSQNSQDVHVCGSCVSGIVWGDARVSSWFSAYLGISCWFARYKRVECDITSDIHTTQYAYANESPILLVSQESVDVLNQALKQQGHHYISTKHFRPNIVVSSKLINNQKVHTLTNPEDSWTSLTLQTSNILLEVKGRCNRCSMVDIDPSSGMRGQTLKTLATYRRDRGNITFGVFLCVCIDRGVQSWDIHEGDEVLVN